MQLLKHFNAFFGEGEIAALTFDPPVQNHLWGYHVCHHNHLSWTSYKVEMEETFEEAANGLLLLAGHDTVEEED